MNHNRGRRSRDIAAAPPFPHTASRGGVGLELRWVGLSGVIYYIRTIYSLYYLNVDV